MQHSHYRNPHDDLNPLSLGDDVHIGSDNDDLKDFAEIWGSPTDPDSPLKQQQEKINGKLNLPQQQQQQLFRSSLHSRHQSYTENSTQVSENSGSFRRATSNVSWASSERGDDIRSTVSNDTEGSRSSVKRRRPNSSYCFEPLAPCKEDDKDVRPYMVEVCDHDVVLGEAIMLYHVVVTWLLFQEKILI